MTQYTIALLRVEVFILIQNIACMFLVEASSIFQTMKYTQQDAHIKGQLERDINMERYRSQSLRVIEDMHVQGAPKSFPHWRNRANTLNDAPFVVECRAKTRFLPINRSIPEDDEHKCLYVLNFLYYQLIVVL